jgi:hypothetical protein
MEVDRNLWPHWPDNQEKTNTSAADAPCPPAYVTTYGAGEGSRIRESPASENARATPMDGRGRLDSRVGKVTLKQPIPTVLLCVYTVAGPTNVPRNAPQHAS